MATELPRAASPLDPAIDLPAHLPPHQGTLSTRIADERESARYGDRVGKALHQVLLRHGTLSD
jgi:hypothetical protein